MTDITYIRTLKGFAYLAIVIDLYSRRVVGWLMQSRQTIDVTLQALLMAVWRRKPQGKVLIHSEQGSQFTSMDWALFLKHHNLEHSISRHGNYHDNAVAESFFNLLKRLKHLSVDPANREVILKTGGIPGLCQLFEEGTVKAHEHASLLSLVFAGRRLNNRAAASIQVGLLFKAI